MWNWLSGKTNSNLPDATPLQKQRSKQIEQLKLFYNNVTEIQRDVEYRVNTTIQGKILSLYITLPPRFPQDRPQVKVSPQVTHPWLDNLMIVTGSPAINHFAVHSDLGAAVKEIVDEFQRNPPTFLPSASFGMDRYTPYPATAGSTVPGTTAGYSPYPVAYPNGTTSYAPQQARMPTLPPSMSSSQSYSYPSPGLPSSRQQVPGSATTTQGMPTVSSVGSSVPSAASTVPSSISPQYPQPYMYTPLANNQQSQTSYSSYQMPEIPTNFAELHSLSKEELQKLLDGEDQLLERIQNSTQLTQLQRDRAKICECNERLARENVSKKPVIEDKKRIILEKYDQLNELRGRFDESAKQQDEFRQKYSKQVLQDRMRIASAQAEEQAEALADNFIDGKISMDDFRKKYMEMRTLSHLRKAKEEKLNSGLVRVPFS